MVELFDEPAREALRLGDGELAELHARAGDRSAEKGRRFGAQAGIVQSARDRVRIALGDIRHEQVLHDRRAQLAGAEALREIGGGAQLLRVNTSAQHRGADVGEARLLLAMHADVIAIDVVRRNLRHRALERERQSSLNVRECSLGGPAVIQKEMFETRALAMLAENLRVAKQFRDRVQHRHDLIGADERIESLREMRFRRQAAA